MAAKRVIKELDAYRRDPSPAVARLQPVRDEDVLQLEATLIGPSGTAYEGTDCFNNNRKFWHAAAAHYMRRRLLGPPHLHPTAVPEPSTGNTFHDPLLSSEREF